MYRLVVAGFMFFVVTGCAVGPKPGPPVLPGKEMVSLQSAVSLSLKVGETSRSARGYLLYKRPDRLHLVVLGPFNMTLLEVYGDGDRLTLMVPPKGIACAGSYAEIPDESGMRSWEIMKWAVQTIPPDEVRRGELVERPGPDGRVETIAFDPQGLMVSRRSAGGEHLFYRDYRLINEVAFPSTMEYRNPQGVQLKMTFNEPEINGDVPEDLLKPNLEGVPIVPLSTCGNVTP